MNELLKPDEFNIQSFYSDLSLNKSLISNEGSKNIQELINYLTEPLKDFDSRRKKEVWVNKALTINQLRKFYDSFLKIYNTEVREEEKKIQLIMLKANADYSAKRLDTKRFSHFLKNRINIVIEKSGKEFIDNLKAFKLHFESLVAYYPKNVKEN